MLIAYIVLTALGFITLVTGVVLGNRAKTTRGQERSAVIVIVGVLILLVLTLT